MAKLNVRQMILWTRTMEIGFAQDKVYGLGRRALRLLRRAVAFDGGECCGRRWPALAGAGHNASASYCWMLSDVGIHAGFGASVKQSWRVARMRFALQQRHAEC